MQENFSTWNYGGLRRGRNQLITGTIKKPGTEASAGLKGSVWSRQIRLECEVIADEEQWVSIYASIIIVCYNFRYTK